MMDELRACDRRRTVSASPRPRSPRAANASALSACRRRRSLPGLPAGTIEIGWRLAPEFWGQGYVTEAADALAAPSAFETLGLDEIVSFAVEDQSPLDRRHAADRHDR